MKPLKCLKIVFFACFGLLLGLSGFAGPVQAATPFQDDFEDYSVGTIKGQGDWTSEYSGCEIQTTYKKTGAQALSCTGNTAYRIGTEALATGTAWEFWVYNPSSSNNPDGRFKLIDGNGTTVGLISFLSATNKVYATIGVNQELGAAPKQTWVKLGFRWDRAAQTVGYGYNGVWQDFAAPSGFDQDVSEIYFLEQNNKAIIIDDITGDPIVVSGYDPIITPTDPPDGETTVVDLDDFTIDGSIQIPTENPYEWLGLIVSFDQVNSTKHFEEQFDFDLFAGDTYDWNATSTLDNAYAYKVSYQIWGITPGTSFIETTYHRVDGTYITETANLLPSWEEVPNWEVPAEEDCDAYSGVDKIICQIKNLLTGLVVPSQTKIDSLKNTMDAFNTKFPMNYISALQGFFEDVQDGLDEEAAINFKVLGQSGTLDDSFWDTAITFGGTAQTIGSLFKSLITAVFVIAFLGWCLAFLGRVF